MTWPMPRDLPSVVLIKWMSVIGPILRKICSNCASYTSLDNQQENQWSRRWHTPSFISAPPDMPMPMAHQIRKGFESSQMVNPLFRSIQGGGYTRLVYTVVHPTKNANTAIIPKIMYFFGCAFSFRHFPPSCKGHIAEEDTPCRRCCDAIARLRVG